MTTSPPEPAPLPEAAETLVRSGLLALSDSYPALPVAVAERLDRVLEELPELTAPDTDIPMPASPRIPWWRRRFALAGVMSVVVVIAGIGVLVIQPWAPGIQPSPTGDSIAANGREATSESNEPKSQPSQEPAETEDVAPESTEYTITYSGHDYQSGELTDAMGPNETGSKADVDSSLDDLRDDSQRREDCVDNMLGHFNGEVLTIDFGSFEDSPAMVTVIDRVDNTTTVVAVGGQCGTRTIDQLAEETF